MEELRREKARLPREDFQIRWALLDADLSGNYLQNNKFQDKYLLSIKCLTANPETGILYQGVTEKVLPGDPGIPPGALGQEISWASPEAGPEEHPLTPSFTAAQIITVLPHIKHTSLLPKTWLLSAVSWDLCP